jgi:hypothetical protein
MQEITPLWWLRLPLLMTATLIIKFYIKN